jgi:hypothetical protein
MNRDNSVSKFEKFLIKKKCKNRVGYLIEFVVRELPVSM